jgi:gentisate 1,2-dioxygenase
VKQAIAKSAGTTIAELSSIRPTWIKSDSVHPPGYRYRWADTEAALKVLGEKPGDPYDGVFLEYVNPLNGGPTLPTMACGIQMIRPGEETRAHRHTSSTVYHVFRGAGATVIENVRFEWEAGDSFTVPLWQFHRHENHFSQPAILFVLSNSPALKALGYYREERAAQ